MDHEVLTTSLNIAISETAWAFIDEEVAREGLENREQYIANLIEDARRRNEERRLEQDLLDGVRSPASPWTDQDREEILLSLEERLADRER